MGNSVVGGLIQMNAHMVMTNTASFVMALGIITAISMVIVGACCWITDVKRWWITIPVTLIFVCMAVFGYRMPRIKEIRACASGPVSLEQVAAAYNIVKVDGKELTLREK